MRVETISSEADFARLADSWDDLVRAMPRPSPFLLHGWLLQWWRHFGGGAELAVLVARRDGSLVGGLPLFVRSRHGIRVAEFLGGHESALADLLLAPGEDPATAGELASSLVATPPVCDVADLYGLPSQSR